MRLEGPSKSRAAFSASSLLSLYSWLQLAGASSLSASECLSLGFHSETLLCSSCPALAPFGLQPLASDCAKCCREEDADSLLSGLSLDDGSASSKYPAALLEVAAFIKSDLPKRYPGLKIKYVRGADPILKLLDEEDDVVETLAIDKWNTDSVEEFLDIYLESTDAPIEEEGAESNDLP